jgi:hypothetical protein
MYAGRNADERESLSLTTGTRAPGFSGQHAIEDNAGWRASNTVGWLANHPPNGPPKDGGASATALALADNDDEEDHILRCLGAAVITRWNTIPTKLQKELFDNASSMGELLKTDVLKGQIARFLHKHKDDA